MAHKFLRKDKIPIKVRITTLLGTMSPPHGSDEWPLEYGNTCTVQDYGSVLNMYTENLEEALKRWPELQDSCEVEIIDWNGRPAVCIIDERIPLHWRNKLVGGDF